jgi:hypothetical protein
MFSLFTTPAGVFFLGGSFLEFRLREGEKDGRRGKGWKSLHMVVWSQDPHEWSVGKVSTFVRSLGPDTK